MADILPLLQRYEGNRVVRGLIQLIPGGLGSAVDVVLVQTLDKIRLKRAKVYFDELASGKSIVDPALLESEDFLHCYMLTARLALNTRRKEKIRMFAKLLKKSLDGDGPNDVDEFEDFVGILNELSFREITALHIMDRYSNVPRDDEQNDLQWINLFWDEFEGALSKELNIDREEIANFMNRIARTGCYGMLTGTYWDDTGGKGTLTPLYRRFKRFVIENE